jgi:hypothetical protein
MIGIVVVSHSRALAEAAVGLASEMVAEDKRSRRRSVRQTARMVCWCCWILAVPC